MFNYNANNNIQSAQLDEFTEHVLGQEDGMQVDPQSFVSLGQLPMVASHGKTSNSLAQILPPQSPFLAPPPQQLPEAQFVRALNESSSKQLPLDSNINVAKDGPPPPVHSLDSPPPSKPVQSHNVTEFTKRRNWPAKLVEELQDLYLILDDNGRIKWVSASAAALTGYSPEQLTGSYIKDFVHQDDAGLFLAELNSSIASGKPMRFFYRFKKADKAYAVFEATGHGHIANPKFAPVSTSKSPFCQAVFMISRLYPPKNSRLLDEFLEHKMENERLKRRIADLRREAELDEKRLLTGPDSAPNVHGTFGLNMTSNPHYVYNGSQKQVESLDISQDNMWVSRGAMTRTSLDGSVIQQNFMGDNMSRYMDRPAEESMHSGLGSGNTSHVVKGDESIEISPDTELHRPTDKKKKKPKGPDEYVCTDCGTLDSPEWRRGPSGPKSLCNACGLRWAKRQRKIASESQRLPSGFAGD